MFLRNISSTVYGNGWTRVRYFSRFPEQCIPIPCRSISSQCSLINHYTGSITTLPITFSVRNANSIQFQFTESNRPISTAANDLSSSKHNIPSESQHGEPSHTFAKRIEEKFGSRLVGWDPMKTNDGQPSIIYTGILKDQIRRLKQFSFFTTAMGVCLQGFLYERLIDSSIVAKAGIMGFFGFFVFVTPLLIHLMAKRYVTELSYDPPSDTYTSVTYSFLLRRNELKFKIEDVTVPTVPGLLTTVLVKAGNKKHSLFLTENCFQDLQHFGRIMGYDKPIDFKN